MIPQIKEINIPSYATLSSAKVTLTEMGDRTITTQLKIDGDIVPNFEGWELEFRGERFILPVREPQAVKDNTTRYSQIDLTFYSWAIYQMKRYFFVEMSSTETGTAIADKYVASLGLSLEDFVDAFNKVLNYYFAGKIQMDLFGKGSGLYGTTPAFVEINYSHIWDVLQKIYEIYEVRWIIEYNTEQDVYVIKVGYPSAEIDEHEFEYGFDGGLLRFERQVQDDNITNLLLGRGGDKNLPYRYFKKADANNPLWQPDPDAIPELKNIYFENLRDINFRNYVQGWKCNPHRTLEEGDVIEEYDAERGQTDWAYAKGAIDTTFNPVEYVKDDASIAKYGERWGALDNNEDIFPTIQGIEVAPYGRIDEVVDVEEITSDDIEAMAVEAATITNLKGGNKTVWVDAIGSQGATYVEVDIEIGEFSVEEGKVANLSRVGNWLKKIAYGEVSKPFGGTKIIPLKDTDIVNDLVIVDTSPGYTEIRVFEKYSKTRVPSSGIPSGDYTYSLHIVLKGTFERSLYRKVEVTTGLESLKLTTSSTNTNAWKPTFDIWVKNLWDTTQELGETDEAYARRVWEPILGDRTGEEASISFSDGFLSISADYSFVIATYPVVDRTKSLNGVNSEWRITLVKSDAEYEALGLYIPNATTGGNARAGDHFFFTGIDMPFIYVQWAEQRLNIYKTENLDESRDINPTWVIQIDKIRANIKDSDFLTNLADRITSGVKIKIKDKRFTDNNTLTLYAQSVSFTWNEPTQNNPYIVPDIEVVLSDKIVAVESTMQRLEGEVSLIQSSYARIGDIESVVRKVGANLFLKKTGESDMSFSPTRFASILTSENFRQGDIGGAGWGAYIDGDNKSVYEVDKLVVREQLRVNDLIVNQIAYLGGKQIISAASMECIKVEDTENGIICYFDQKQGSISNLFEVDDIILGQVFQADETELRYYRYRVIATAEDSITLSKTDFYGEDIPEVGDILVQYGNYSDTARQYVIIRDVIGGGYERMILGLSTVYSEGVEYYFAGKQDGQSERWFIGNRDAGQYAEYKNNELRISGKLSVASQIEKTDGSYTTLSTYLNDLEDMVYGAIETWYYEGEPTLNNPPANTWITVSDKNEHIGDIYFDKLTGKAYRFMLDNEDYVWVQISDEDVAEALRLAQINSQNIDALSYLKQATNNGTLVSGGLVLTSLIQLGNVEEGSYIVYAGINGIRNSEALGGGIASWYGGAMIDREIASNVSNVSAAKSLFRFDGSGYLASGNIGWDANGYGHIPGISWDGQRVMLSSDIYIQGDGDFIKITNAVNRMYSQFSLDSENRVVLDVKEAIYIPTSPPRSPLAGKVSLFFDFEGSYAESGGGGVADVYKLYLQRNGVQVGVFDAGGADATININVPTMVSELLNDAGYLTQHQSLADYYTKTEVNNLIPDMSAYLPKTYTKANYGTASIGWGANGKLTINGSQYTNLNSPLLIYAGASANFLMMFAMLNDTATRVGYLGYYSASFRLFNSQANKGLGVRDNGTPVFFTSATSYVGLWHQGNLTNVSQLNNDAGYLTEHQSLADYINNGAYNSTTKRIELRHGSTVISSIDATEFIKDGMVDSVTVENGYIIIVFNTDSGKEPISIPITDIFDASLYYTKTETANIFATKAMVGALKLSDLTDDILSGYYLPLSGGTINGSLVVNGLLDASVSLVVPTVAPANPLSGKTYFYLSSTGSYAESGGGGVADVYKLYLKRNNVQIGVFDAGAQDATINIEVPTKVSDLNNDLSFVTNSDLSTALASYVTSSALATTLADYALISSLPTNLTDLTNDLIPAWALASTKPTYNYSEIVDAPDVSSMISTALTGYSTTTEIGTMLSAYLPLSGGVMTGAITWGGNNTCLAFANTAGTKAFNLISLQGTTSVNPYITIGQWVAEADSANRSLIEMGGYQYFIRFGYRDNPDNYIQLTSTGELSRLRSMTPLATNTYNLGTAGYTWANIYTQYLNLANGGSLQGYNTSGRVYVILSPNASNGLSVGNANWAHLIYQANTFMVFQVRENKAWRTPLRIEGSEIRTWAVRPATSNTYDIGTTTYQYVNGYIKNLIASESVKTAVAEVSTNLAIPTTAPTNPDSSKVYLYFSATGVYAE